MFKDVLETLMKKKGMNANGLAKQINVPKSVVYGWKNGEREPSMEHLKTLSAYFNVSLEYLCETEELVLPEPEQKLITMLRSTKEVSDDAYQNIIDNFSRNISFFLEVSKKKQ